MQALVKNIYVPGINQGGSFYGRVFRCELCRRLMMPFHVLEINGRNVNSYIIGIERGCVICTVDCVLGNKIGHKKLSDLQYYSYRGNMPMERGEPGYNELVGKIGPCKDCYQSEAKQYHFTSDNYCERTFVGYMYMSSNYPVDRNKTKFAEFVAEVESRLEKLLRGKLRVYFVMVMRRKRYITDKNLIKMIGMMI